MMGAPPVNVYCQHCRFQYYRVEVFQLYAFMWFFHHVCVNVVDATDGEGVVMRYIRREVLWYSQEEGVLRKICPSDKEWMEVKDA